MVACALAAIAELKFGIRHIGAAAYGTFMTKALRLLLILLLTLLIAHGVVEVRGLLALVALKLEKARKLRPEEDDEVEKRHDRQNGIIADTCGNVAENVEEEGEYIWPRVMRPSDGKFFGFDNQVLSLIKAQYLDKTQFYAQYYNNPNDESTNRISYDKFQYYDKKFLRQEDGKWYFKKDRLNIYAAIDFAYSLNKKADSTAIVVIGIDSDDNIYVLDLDAFKTDKISEYFDRLKRLHAKWNFNKLRAEITAAQSIIVRDIKDTFRKEGLSISIDEFRPSMKEGTKIERISATLDWRYEKLKMWHFKGGFTEVLEDELVKLNPAHDDLKDALASAVSIAVKPKKSYNNTYDNKKQMIFSSRFGGVAFR